ncbi:MAG: aspartate aminotransferase family protein [Gemmatimonadetes bacterium]|nr:aspartate aminotransferase family protein [Gemmatimonadota bacterium]
MSLRATTTETLSTAEWQELDRRHHVHPFIDSRAIEEKGTRVIVGAEGSHLIDSDGRRILDGMAGLWCVNLGYGRHELAQAAYDQMVELPYYNTFFRSAPPPTIELSRILAELTPGDLGHAFFSSSGSEANDTIVRLVRRYWDVRDRPTKKTFISRTYAYHGSTMAAASLGGFEAMHAVGDLPLPGFEHVMPPYWFAMGGPDETPEDTAERAARALEDKILELGPENVAAFIGEPVIGAGGVIVPPDDYWPEVQRICREHDVLLVCDEVITGFGRTGAWFGAQTFDIEPDLMTIAKGLSSGYAPISAVLMTDAVFETLSAGGVIPHGYTYSGHPVSAAVAIENLRLMKEEGLVERVRDETGPLLQERLRTLADHPLVGEVRGVGLLGALELVEDKATRKHFEPMGRVAPIAHEHCYDEGVVLRAMRDVLCTSPPLSIEPHEIDELVERTARGLDRTAAELGLG